MDTSKSKFAILLSVIIVQLIISVLIVKTLCKSYGTCNTKNEDITMNVKVKFGYLNTKGIFVEDIEEEDIFDIQAKEIQLDSGKQIELA